MKNIIIIIIIIIIKTLFQEGNTISTKLISLAALKNNIKKALVKFWEDLLYFQHFMQIFILLQISDYHHLK